MAENTTDDSKPNIVRLKEAVNALYDFRDHFFERNSIDRAVHKNEEVKQQLQKTLEVFEELQDTVDSSCKAELLLLKGRAWNVLPDFSPEALECLSKAVKLDPKLVEAWNNLGETYWKKKDVKAAKNCFEGALNHQNNKVSLRNLSMVLRQLGSDPTEKAKFLQESVDYAKKAVSLDMSDGTSWFIAGNAYLSMFFMTGQKAGMLKQCLGAYAQAERDSIAKCNPDLHFNKATIFKFQEEYELSLDGFAQAKALDPVWDEPAQKRADLVSYLSRVTELTKAKGKMKAKRLQQLMSSFKDSDLGPYGGGSYTSPTGQTVKLEAVMLSRLTDGANQEKVVVGKVVCSVGTDEPIPFTFAIVDSEGSCYAVNVFNIAQGQGVIIGDTVAIPEPYLRRVDFTIDDKHIQYSCLRVNTPVALVVNGKKLGIEKQAPATLSVSAKSD
ncbi:tetratricopeptide repeat protein 5-like [Diadema antillarum]|uniref:tetratricopeptide repeat protein 5-like n=1 Tax=Diadema antillarum TaxID=105358 RepID=UPI003A8A7CFD